MRIFNILRQSGGYLYALLTLLIWSSFVVMSKLGGQQGLNPGDITALRVGAAALCLAPWWLPRLMNKNRRKLKIHQTVILAVLAGIGYPLIAYSGFQHAPASHGAVLIAGLLPLSTSIFSFVLLKEHFSWQKICGLGLIVSGALAILFKSATVPGLLVQGMTGDLLLISAGTVWALFTVLIRYWKVAAFDVTLAVSAAAALIYLPVYLLLLPKQLMAISTQHVLEQAIFQGVVVVCLAMWTYGKAIELLGSVKTVMLLSTVPLTGSILSMIVLGEPVASGVLLGGLLATIGAVIGIQTPKKRVGLHKAVD